MRGEHAASLCRCFDSFGQQKAPVTRQTQEPELKQALSDYCHLAGTEEAMFLPLQVEGQTVGGLLIGMSTSQLDARGFSESATFLASQFAPVWKTFLRSGTTWYGLLWKGLVERCPVNMRKHWMWVVASLLVCFCFPVPYRVSCNSELQPVKRRYVAAPFEGVLDSVLARSGDVVEQNQLLATMDGSALQFERSGLQAQLVAAQKKRDAALAAGSIAESQIAKSEVRKCEAELALIDSKLSRLEMRSPMAGVVVSGDVDQVEGARLEMGKSLFEVAPLEKMTVEMRIPEVDARHVEAGQTARMKFSSYPFRTWEGQIVRVHPRSELVQDANVFIAEVELDNEDGRLRPGMKGWGKVAAGWKPLGWVWLHHAWERVRYVFVW
jgi:biotin carboxyl carrier protein